MLRSVTVEAMVLIKCSINMINCGLISHVYFATPPMPVIVTHILTHSVNLDFWTKSGFKNKCQARAGFRLQNETRYNPGYKISNFVAQILPKFSTNLKFWVCACSPCTPNSYITATVSLSRLR